MDVDRESLGREPQGRIRVFGGVGIVDHGEPVSIGGPRQRRLLALLAIRAGAIAELDWLAENIWTDDDMPDDYEATLRTYVSRLRRSLPEGAGFQIETVSGGYRLEAAAPTLEHVRFGDLRAKALVARERQDPLTAEALLDAALELYRDDPFPELEDLSWARGEIERLKRERLEMIEERFEVALALGRHTQVIGELASFTGEHGLRERARRQYALALHRAGRTAEAVRAIQEFRADLVDVAGLDPSPEMIRLEARLLAGDPDLDVGVQGRPLRGYRLLEQIGTGAFSLVWRGLQPSVDRDVAIKQIRAELATQPAFIRRFEAEAQLVARIEHPHIVPLIDFWRDPDSAYLVMRWLRGGTLEDLIDRGPLDVDRTLEVLTQVGGALAVAHSHGVIHRDVKSANILFDEHDNAYLGDFGIALEVTATTGPEAALSHGSPGYASPEQLRRELLGPGADVFSLGVVAFECLAGSLPFAEETDVAELVRRQMHEPFPRLSSLRSDVPASVDDAVARATAKDPTERFSTVEAFLDALAHPTTLPQTSGRSTAVDGPVVNPYLGLRAFDEADAGHFFGRDRLVAEVVGRLSGSGVPGRCVVLVGPSGSGKSSVARAGVIPALRAGGTPESATWFTTAMVPGDDPFEALETALLRVAVNPPTALVSQLRDGPRGILRGLRRCVASDDERVFLLIDQLEELFTRAPAHDVDAFLNGLAVAIEAPNAPLRLVATLRADFYDRPLRHPKFARVLKAAAVDVTPLAPDELEEAIVEPARRVGVDFEAGLVARLAAETLGQSSPLPLLQHTLAQLFDRRAGATITAEVYDHAGGMSGALAAHAEQIHQACSADERAAARRVFGQLVDPDPERGDLRRRALLADLGDDEATRSVIERFAAGRLITLDRHPVTREPTLDVAHEALLREWPRLAAWIAEDRALLGEIDRLAAAADRWDEEGRDDAGLLRGGRLDVATTVVDEARDRLRPVDRAFVDASRQRADADARLERNRVRRLRRLVVGIGAALAVALVAGGVATVAQRRANDEADRASSAQGRAEAARADAEASRADAEVATLIARSEAEADERPDRAVLLALEAHRRDPGPETEAAVLSVLAGLGMRVGNLPAPFGADDCAVGDNFAPDVVLSPDGTAYYATRGTEMHRQDLTDGRIESVGSLPEECARWGADRDETWQVAISADNDTVWLGDYGAGWNVEVPLTGPSRLAATAPSDLRRFFVTSGDIVHQTGHLLDGQTGEPVGPPIEGLSAGHARFSADGRLLVVGSGHGGDPDGPGPVRLFDAETGQELWNVDAPSRAQAFAFDEAAGEILAGTVGGELLPIALADGAIGAPIPTSIEMNIDWLERRDDGSVVVGSQGLIEIVTRDGGPVLGTQVDPNGAHRGALRPDGVVVIHARDRSSELLDFRGAGLLLVDQAIEGIGDQARFGFDAVAWADPASHEVTLASLVDGSRQSVLPLDEDGGVFASVAVTPEPDGYVAFSLNHGLARFVDDELVGRLELADFTLNGGGGRPGTMALVGNANSTVHVIDTSDLSVLLTLELDPSQASTAHPTAAGGVHVVAGDGTLRSYSSASEPVGSIDTGLTNPFIVLEVSDGVLAVAGRSGTALVSLDTGEVQRLPDVGETNGLAVVPGRDLLVIVQFDGTVRLWDLAENRSRGVLLDAASGGVNPLYDESSDSIWVAVDGDAVRVPLDPDRWIALACEYAGRELTSDEWREYVPGDLPQQPVCDDASGL